MCKSKNKLDNIITPPLTYSKWPQNFESHKLPPKISIHIYFLLKSYALFNVQI